MGLRQSIQGITLAVAACAISWAHAAQPQSGPGATLAGSKPAWLDCARHQAMAVRSTAATVSPAARLLEFEQAVHAVVCNSSGQRLAPSLQRRAQAALDQAQRAGQPALSLATGADLGDGQSLQATAQLRASWNLFDFGASSAAMEGARLGVRAVQEEQRSAVLAAAAQAAQLYTTAQAAIARAHAAGINLRTAFDNSRAAAARQSAGAATLADKLQARTALSQSQLELAGAMSQWQAARGALALAMGQPAESVFDLPPYPETDTDLPPPPQLQALMAEARDRHPRIAGARIRLLQAQSRVHSVQAERWGSINASASSGLSRSAGSRNGNSSASIEWNVPLIFDRGVQRAREEEAYGQAQEIQVGVEDSEREVIAQVWAEGQALLGQIEGVRASLAVLRSADLALGAASARFRQGASSFSDVLSAQTSAANARFQWVESRAALARAQLRLAAAVGRFGDLRL